MTRPDTSYGVRGPGDQGGDGTDAAYAREQGPREGVPPALYVLWRGRWIIVSCTIAFMALGVVWATLFGRKYTATASFVVQSRRDAAGLSGIAAQFGVQLPTGDAAQSPQFYADLIGTSALLGELSDCPIRVDSSAPAAGASAGASASTRPLGMIVFPDVTPAPTRQERLTRWLRPRLLASANTRSGVVSLRFGHRDPGVAYGVIACALRYVDDYNRKIRRSNASAERQFAEARVAAADGELRAAENELQYFMERNRADEASPPLKFQRERLTRRQQERQQVSGALKQMLEQARLEEVRDTPVISVVESPRLPALPDAGTRSRSALVAGIVGFFFAALWVLFSEARPRLRALFARAPLPRA